VKRAFLGTARITVGLCSLDDCIIYWTHTDY
jgi:hypothetical protein